MPNKCVVGGCSNAPDLPSGIGLHTIPFFGDERHEAKKRRKKWVDFVKAKRAKWEPTKNSVVCTKHFRVQDLEKRFTNLPGQKPAVPRLTRDSFGVCVYPTLHATSTPKYESESSESPKVSISDSQESIFKRMAWIFEGKGTITTNF